MQLFFIDESGTVPPKDKIDNVEFFTLGGIIIPEDLWHEIDKELAFLKAQYKVTDEIKWRYFSPQKAGAKAHSLSHLTAQQKNELRLQIYSLITKFKSIRLISAVVDIHKAYKLSYVYDDNELTGAPQMLFNLTEGHGCNRGDAIGLSKDTGTPSLNG